MSFSYRYLGVVALGAGLVLSACGTKSEAELQSSDGGGVSGVDASIVFEHEGTLTLAPRQVVAVHAKGSPPARYAMSFYLVGEALDASLDHSSVVADDNGRATVMLRAPNATTNFVLRATIKDGPSAELQVSVSDLGFGTLDINPVYSGQRETRKWRANVMSGATCKALAPTFPNDPEGALTASAAPGDPLLIEGAPVGPNLAVFVRGGHYMWGCTDEPDLVAGSTTKIEVRIINKPIDMTDADLRVELEFVPEPDPWQEILDDSTTRLLDAFMDLESTEAEQLLDAMAAAHADPEAFEAARAIHGWDPLLRSYWLSQNMALRVMLTDWIGTGMAAQPPTIFGRVTSVPQGTEQGLFVLDAIGAITAQDAGAPTEYLVTWAADPDDTVRLGGLLFWLPSRLLGAAAHHAVDMRYPQELEVWEALAQTLDCREVGELLGGQLPECDADCKGQLCERALENLWAAALNASAAAGIVGEISLEASGAASFDDDAALTGFGGWWLGQVTDGLVAAKVEGAVSAEESGEPVAE